MAVNLNRASLLRCHLRTGVALMALALAAQAAHAQVDVTQTNVSNSGTVVNGTPDLTTLGVGGLTSGATYQVVSPGTTSLTSQSVDANGVFTYDGTALTGTGTFIPYLPNAINSGNAVNLGTGSSASIGATGAVASVSVSSINMALPNPSGGFGGIAQGVGNSGDVTNAYGYTDGGGVFHPTAALQMNLGGGSIGQGASASISASGAVASVSVSGVDDGSGPGSFSLPAIGSVSQYQPWTGWFAGDFSYAKRADVADAGPYPGVTNSGDVFNWGAISEIGTMAPGGSISVSGSGAVASVSLSTAAPGVVPDTSLGTAPGATVPYTVNVTANDVGNVGQWSRNTGAVDNTGTLGFNPGGGLGVGGSASVSASGAVASLSSSNVNVSLTGLNFGAVEQGALNLGSAGISNTGAINLAGATLSQGASVSVSATGAVSSLSVAGISQVGGLTVDMPSIGGVVTYADGSQNNSYLPVSASFGIAQVAQNQQAIGNTGSINGLGSALESGASASVSASGAVASVSFSGNNVNLGGWANIQSTSQVVTNSGNVTNLGDINAVSNTSLGQAASASVGATGAVASFSASVNDGDLGAIMLGTPNNNFNPLGIDGDYFNISALRQSAYSSGAINNVGGSIDLGNSGSLGRGASAAVSATGAVASFSVSGVAGAGADVWLPYVAGTADQRSTNDGTVSNSGAVITAGNLGSGASVSASASGAVASFSISGNNVSLLGDSDSGLGRAGGVAQHVINNANVSNTNAFVRAGDIGTGGSVSIAASGSAASLGVSALNSSLVDTGGDPAALQFGYINLPYYDPDASVWQYSSNAGAITNSGVINLANGTAGSGALGRGASASISSTGAVVSVSASAVSDSGGTVQLPAFYGGINQITDGGASNTGAISNTGQIKNAGDLATGASASVSASGAVASISFSGNNVSLGGGAVGSISQYAFNDGGSVINSAAPGGGQFGIQAGDLGTSASVSLSASGAVSSTSVSAVNSSLSGLYFSGWYIGQRALNYAAIQNTGTIDLGNGAGNEGALGRGASVAVSATGAVGSFSVSAVSDSGSRPTINFPDIAGSIGWISATNGSSDVMPAVTNTGAITSVGDLAAGASASISATGAVASASLSGNNVNVVGSDINYNEGWIGVDETARNYGAITNSGTTLSAGSLGDGASASISATGAVASMSMSFLNSSFASQTGFSTSGLVRQEAGNSNAVTNAAGSGTSSISVGSLSGTGASASIGSTGAVSSLSFANTASSGSNNVSVSFGGVQQRATNGEDYYGGDSNFTASQAKIRNSGSITLGGDMTGVGSSASVSATGAVASVSYSTVSTSGTSNASFSMGNVEQTANNGQYGSTPPIINSGDITIGGSMAKGASASVSATGSAASFQVASLNDTTALGSISVGSVTQSAQNYGSVSNAGSIAFNGGGAVTLGTGASASISATGAAASVSFRAVK